jgi:hypothetical protein
VFYKTFFGTGSLNNLQTRQATVQWRRGSLFLPDTLEEWLPHTLQTSALWLKLRPAPREWLSHDWTRKALQFAVRRNLENYHSERGLPSFTTHANNMLFTVIWGCVYLCRVASGAMRCFDCTWRTRTRAERFSISLEMPVSGYAGQAINSAMSI